MARPRKFDREEAVSLAMNEIWRGGYEANSVKQLSARLGISRSSFYNAFGSREDLFKEVLDRYVRQSPDRPLALATPDMPVRKLLTRTFRDVVRARAADGGERGCLAVNCVAELCNVDDDLGDLLAAALLGSVSRIERLLEWAVQSGELDAGTDRRATALALKNCLIGLNVMCKVVRCEDDLWKTAEATLRGLGLYEDDAS